MRLSIHSFTNRHHRSEVWGIIIGNYYFYLARMN